MLLRPVVVIVTVLAAVVSFSARAGCTSHSTSTYTFTSCTDGTSSMSQTIGSNTFTSSSDGGSATSFTSGNTTYHSGRAGNGTSYRSGDYAQHTWSDGSSGTTHYEEGAAYHQWRADSIGTEQKIKDSPQAGVVNGEVDRRAIYGHIAGGSGIPD